MTNNEMRELSGSVRDGRVLVVFLYHLLRDHMPSGEVEKLMERVEGGAATKVFTNGWTARHAQCLADRLVPPQVVE